MVDSRKPVEESQNKKALSYYKNSVDSHTVHDSASQVRHLPDMLAEDVIFRDVDLRIVWANTSMSKRHGKVQNELTGQCCYEAFHNRQEPCEDCTAMKVLKTGRAHEFGCLGTDGVRRAVRMHPICDEHGQVAGVVEIAHSHNAFQRMQETLRASDERFRQMLNELPNIAVQGYRPDGTVLFWNRASEKIYGYKNSEAVGKNLFDLIIPPEMQAEAREMVAQAAKTGHMSQPMEYQLMRKDGSRVAVFSSHVVLTQENREPELFCIDVDLQELKQVEDALRNSEAKLRLIFEGARGVSFIISSREGKDSRIQEFSPGSENIFGYTREEAMGKPLSMLLLDEDAVKLPEMFDRIGREVNGFAEETTLVRKSGERFPAFVTAYPMYDSAGEYCAALGVAIDITERKRAQMLAERQRNQLLSIFDNINEPVYIADPNTYELLYTNEASKTLFGAHPGQKCYQALHGTDKPCSFCTNHKIFGDHTGSTYIGEQRNAKNKRWYRCIDKAIQWPDGRMVRYEMAIDITDQKQAEQERQRLQKRLQEAQKLESLSSLAGGIAHDFNNLLGVILGNAELALELMPLTDENRDLINEIKKASLRAADLTSQMLAYSGNGRFVVEPLNLNFLLGHMQRVMEVSISDNVTMLLNLAEKIPTVHADASQIRQLVMNLILNAAEAITGPGVITISTKAVNADANLLAQTHLAGDLPEGQYVMLEVSDTGCGMDEQTMARLFDPFFSTRFTGRGLGLSAVLGIVRGHNGAIKVHSKEGLGTTIQVLLPASNQQTGHSVQYQPCSQPLGPNHRTVLVVDDEQPILQVFSHMLEQLGYNALTASSAVEALDIFSDKHAEISLVLMDLSLPGMHGQELLNALRQIDPDIKIVLCSGYQEYEASGLFDGEEVSGFLQKPFKLETLGQTLQQVLIDSAS